MLQEQCNLLLFATPVELNELGRVGTPSALMRGPQKKPERSSNTFLGGAQSVATTHVTTNTKRRKVVQRQSASRATWRSSLTALVAALQVDVGLGRPFAIVLESVVDAIWRVGTGGFFHAFAHCCKMVYNTLAQWF